MKPKQEPKSSSSQEIVAYREDAKGLTESGDMVTNLRRRIRNIGKLAGMDAVETGSFPIVRPSGT